MQDELEQIKTQGVPRSPKWDEVRATWLRDHPLCAACGSDKDPQVHHIVPFHTDMDKELDPTNFMTLCEGMERNCHRFIGHLDNFQSINRQSRVDAAFWLKRIRLRPKWDKEKKKWV